VKQLGLFAETPGGATQATLDTGIRADGPADVSLVQRLLTLLADGPASLEDLYQALPRYRPHSVRARLSEHTGRGGYYFERVARGVYTAQARQARVLVIVGDAWELITETPDDTIDLVICDPPYTAIDHHFHGTTRSRNQRGGFMFETRDLDIFMVSQIARVLKSEKRNGKNSGGAYCFIFAPALAGDTVSHLWELLNVLEQAGLRFYRAWPWDKQVIGMGYAGRAQHELVLVCGRGPKKLKPFDLSIPDVHRVEWDPNGYVLGRPDIVSVRRIPSARRVHECQKPAALIEVLVRFATQPGDVVLDPFAGSGVVGQVALDLGRHAILLEQKGSFLEPLLNGRRLP